MSRENSLVQRFFCHDVSNVDGPIVARLHLTNRANAPEHLEPSAKIPVVAKSNKAVAVPLQPVNPVTH